MGFNIYKGNKNKTGGMGDFSFSAKDRALYVGLIKQTSYDESKKLAGFSGGERLSLKFNVTEIGAILRTIRTTNFNALPLYHKAQTKTTIINFTPYNKKVDGKDSGELAGFGFRATVESDGSKTTFSLPLSLDETEAFLEYLTYGLSHVFNDIYSEDKKRAQDFLAKKEGQNSKPAPEKQEEKPKVADAPQDEDVDF